jgi:hypothetical protein
MQLNNVWSSHKVDAIKQSAFARSGGSFSGSELQTTRAESVVIPVTAMVWPALKIFKL